MKMYDRPPPTHLDPQKSYLAEFQTRYATFRFSLFGDDTPTLVNNFIYLALDGFYDNTVFHRVIDNFVIQGGDPEGSGKGGPGYQLKDEFSARNHVAGCLSMANAGPNTNGSQFFITLVDAPWLNGRYSVIGQSEGDFEVLRSIRATTRLETVRIIDGVTNNTVSWPGVGSPLRKRKGSNGG
jgi:cyclophilin family peptidyl-prolyl cis-trans isomerase